MAAPLHYKTPQNTETPVAYGEVGGFCYRFAYSRSADSLKSNENGQDYLSLLTDGNRFVFALCDGVSQSFYGDLAARLLGEHLVEFFKKTDISEGLEAVKVKLLNSLNRLTDTATRQVQDHALPAGLAPMLVGVLERKRQIGSESTFIAGVLDATSGLACFAWMGDSRLRLWNSEAEVTHLLGETFHTSERWSTKKGAVGDVHVTTQSASVFNHLIAYSDGFSYLDKVFTQEVAAQPWAHQTIREFMMDASRRPSSDDISFLEVWLGKKPNIPDGSETLRPPQIETTAINPSAENLEMKWKSVPGANEYEIEISSDAGVLFSEKVAGTYWRTTRLTQQAQTVSIRAWKGSAPGLWSNKFPIYESNTPVISHDNEKKTHPLIPERKKREYVFAWLFDWRKFSFGLIGFILFSAFVCFGMVYIGRDLLIGYLHTPTATDTKVLPTIFPSSTTIILTATPNLPEPSLEFPIKAIVREYQVLRYPDSYSEVLPQPAIGEEVIILYKYQAERTEEVFFYVQFAESKGWMKASWLDLSSTDVTKIPDAPKEFISTPAPTPEG